MGTVDGVVVVVVVVLVVVAVVVVVVVAVAAEAGAAKVDIDAGIKTVYLESELGKRPPLASVSVDTRRGDMYRSCTNNSMNLHNSAVLNAVDSAPRSNAHVIPDAVVDDDAIMSSSGKDACDRS